MTRIEIDDKEYSLPTSFDELTLGKYCEAFHGIDIGNDVVDDTARLIRMKVNESIIVSRLLGESDEFAMDLPLVTYNKIADKIGYIYNFKVMLENARASVMIDGDRYGVEDVERMSMRQFIDADMVMREEGNRQYVSLLAVLLLKVGDDGKYEKYDGKYEERVDKIAGLKCSEALPLVFHFFKGWEASRRISQASIKEEEKR